MDRGAREVSNVRVMEPEDGIESCELVQRHVAGPVPLSRASHYVDIVVEAFQ